MSSTRVSVTPPDAARPRGTVASTDLVLLRAAWSLLEPVRGTYDDTAFADLRRRVLDVRRSGREPLLVVHDGALPDWQVARGGWLDRDALAAWGCYTERLAATMGESLRAWVPFDRLLDEAAAYDTDARRVARVLLDAHAAAYLHLRRGPGHGGRPAWVGMLEDVGARTARGSGPTRASDDDVAALARVLATGRLALPFAPVGELPNGTPALDFVGLRWSGPSGSLEASVHALWEHRLPIALLDAVDPAGSIGPAAFDVPVRALAARGVRLWFTP